MKVNEENSVEYSKDYFEKLSEEFWKTIDASTEDQILKQKYDYDILFNKYTENNFLVSFLQELNILDKICTDHTFLKFQSLQFKNVYAISCILKFVDTAFLLIINGRKNFTLNPDVLNQILGSQNDYMLSIDEIYDNFRFIKDKCNLNFFNITIGIGKDIKKICKIHNLIKEPKARNSVLNIYKMCKDNVIYSICDLDKMFSIDVEENANICYDEKKTIEDAKPGIKYIYVILPDESIKIKEREDTNRFNMHSNLTCGGPVICAGELQVEKSGNICYISNESGHYIPDLHALKNGIDVFIKKGLFPKDYEFGFTENPTKLYKGIPTTKNNVI